jgi:hypothetical protein
MELSAMNFPLSNKLKKKVCTKNNFTLLIKIMNGRDHFFYTFHYYSSVVTSQATDAAYCTIQANSSLYPLFVHHHCLRVHTAFS